MKKNFKYLFIFCANLFCFCFYTQQNVAQTNKTTIKVEKNNVPKDSIKNINDIQLIQMGDSLVEIRGNFIQYKKNAHASYYAEKFNGKRTASGTKFSNNAMTCAHKKLPFGTKLKVTNEVNKKFVLVEVTDRGPYVKGRELDLSRKAFMVIAHNKGSGAVNVTIEMLKK